MFVQDYSGFTRAAEIQAQGMQNLGKGIAQGIEQFQELKKKGNLLSAEKKKDAMYIDSAINIWKDKDPNKAAQLQAERAMMDDSSLSLEQQVMQGKATRDAISTEFDLGYKAARMFKAQGQAGGGSGGFGGNGDKNASSSDGGGFDPFK
jgi:hypothetical protein